MKKFFHPLPQKGVATAFPVKVTSALPGRQFQRNIEHLNLAFGWLRHRQRQSFTHQCERNSAKVHRTIYQMEREIKEPFCNRAARI
jgi:hypothetical protein